MVAGMPFVCSLPHRVRLPVVLRDVWVVCCGCLGRYLANKCSIAARVDAFSEGATSKYGEALRDQVTRR